MRVEIFKTSDGEEKMAPYRVWKKHFTTIELLKATDDKLFEEWKQILNDIDESDIDYDEIECRIKRLRDANT